MKEPQRCIGSVVEPFPASLRKKIWNQAVAYRVSKIAQDPARLQRAIGHKRQSFETDHCVSPPIGKPMITGHYGAHFIAQRIGASGIDQATRRNRNELIRSKNQFGSESGASFRMRRSDEAVPTFAFGIPSGRGVHGPDSLPRLR